MFNAIVSHVALEMLVRYVRECRSDPSVDSELCREIRRLFWDYKYLYIYGLAGLELPAAVPVPSIPWQEPTPTPVIEQLQHHEEILNGLIDIVAGDPTPQRSIQAVLQDRESRLAAARGLAQRFETGLKQVNEEIERLNEVSPQ